MARRTLKHEAAAFDRAHEHVGQMTRAAIDASRASRSPAARLYGAGGPQAEEPAQRPTGLTPTDVRAIEHALKSGAKAHAVVAALRQAGLVAGGAKSAPPTQDRGATSPLGGQARSQ
jgi:hypothetical protein